MRIIIGKICRKCKEVFENSPSEFCQHCGTKLIVIWADSKSFKEKKK